MVDRVTLLDLDLVGTTEVADRLGVQRQTVGQWRLRHVMVEPTWTISGVPIWRWEVVEHWARETGRLPVEVA